MTNCQCSANNTLRSRLIQLRRLYSWHLISCLCYLALSYLSDLLLASLIFLLVYKKESLSKMGFGLLNNRHLL